MIGEVTGTVDGVAICETRVVCMKAVVMADSAEWALRRRRFGRGEGMGW